MNIELGYLCGTVFINHVYHVYVTTVTLRERNWFWKGFHPVPRFNIWEDALS